MNKAMKNFAYNPVSLSIPRSKMTMKHSHKTTFDTGRLIPIYWREVLPGSTVKMEMAEIVRMQTPIFPIMDNAFIDTYFFFVPNRIIWEHWEEFMGENKNGFWEQKTAYEVPQIQFCHDMTPVSASGTYWKGTNYYPYGPQACSLADYLGIPIVDANKSTPVTKGEFEVNALPFRAYYQVFNDWFRDENLMFPIDYDKGDTTAVACWTSTDPDESWPVSMPKMVAKFHDYFTSALPQPQKHDDVMVGLGSLAPVVFASPENAFNASVPIETSANGHSAGIREVTQSVSGTTLGYADFYDADDDWTGSSRALTKTKSYGLAADLEQATGISINSLRQAFAVQRYYEKQARGGTRYIEQLKSMFGVTSPDARLQRAEYLGGCRKAVNIDQVVQTSATDNVTPQGNVAAYSLTSQNEDLFTKSFVEHGILIGVQVIRVEHSYQDGLNKMWLRKSEFDYYNPTFANIGEMPIYNKEIFLAGNVSGTKDDEAFGYQEAWAEYRYMNNRVSGEMRSDYFQSLDAWHFADNYSGLPTLSFAWIEETPSVLNRNIAVSSRLSNQWLADVFFKETWTQPMPVYSIPGLIDHY